MNFVNDVSSTIAENPNNVPTNTYGNALVYGFTPGGNRYTLCYVDETDGFVVSNLPYQLKFKIR